MYNDSHNIKVYSEVVPTGVRDKSNNMMKNDFVNLDHTLEGLMPGRSLPAYFKQCSLGKGF